MIRWSDTPREPRLRVLPSPRVRSYTLREVVWHVVAWSAVAFLCGVALGQDVFAVLWPVR